eukprot:c4852_g1_i1 orf=307-531(+)
MQYILHLRTVENQMSYIMNLLVFFYHRDTKEIPYNCVLQAATRKRPRIREEAMHLKVLCSFISKNSLSQQENLE